MLVSDVEEKGDTRGDDEISSASWFWCIKLARLNVLVRFNDFDVNELSEDDDDEDEDEISEDFICMP